MRGVRVTRVTGCVRIRRMHGAAWVVGHSWATGVIRVVGSVGVVGHMRRVRVARVVGTVGVLRMHW